jgi:hypothetical protein
MRASIILTTLFTALAAAAPITIDAPTTDISARQVRPPNHLLHLPPQPPY